MHTEPEKWGQLTALQLRRNSSVARSLEPLDSASPGDQDRISVDDAMDGLLDGVAIMQSYLERHQHLLGVKVGDAGLMAAGAIAPYVALVEGPAGRRLWLRLVRRLSPPFSEARSEEAYWLADEAERELIDFLADACLQMTSMSGEVSFEAVEHYGDFLGSHRSLTATLLTIIGVPEDDIRREGEVEMARIQPMVERVGFALAQRLGFTA
jgi:hypothetical protein